MEKKLIILLFLLIPSVFYAQNRKKSEACYLEAFKYYKQEEYSKAISSCKKAISKDNTFPDPVKLLATIYENQGNLNEAISLYPTIFKINSEYQPNYLFYAQLLYKAKKEKEALEALNNFYLLDNTPTTNKKNKANETTRSKVKNLKETIELSMKDNTKELELEITNLGSSVNTKENEYWPGMTLDGKYLFFTKLKMSEMQEDLYYSELNNNTFLEAKLLPGRINTVSNNEGTVAVNPMGSTILYTVCNEPDGLGSCDIYESTLNGINWSPRENLGSVINSNQWDAQPTLGYGGNILIFASGRSGGFGGKDLYISTKVNNKWSTPKNMGQTINTRGDDEAPYLHYDGSTLYFSSNGHTGFGGLDLFVSKMDENENWGTPINVGKFINTEADETGLYVDQTGNKAYFASDREGSLGGIDLWSFKLKEELKPSPANILELTVIDATTKQPVEAQIQLTNLINNKPILDQINSVIQTYYPSGGNFGLLVQAAGYLPFTQNYNKLIKAQIGAKEQLTIELVKPIKGSAVVLKNIFFDFDKSNLKPESNAALTLLFDYLEQNKEIKIEIGGYTDNQGTQAYNLELSNQRAGSVFKYLVEKGINANRLKFKGYGSLATDDNSTPEKQAINRRIEIKVI